MDLPFLDIFDIKLLIHGEFIPIQAAFTHNSPSHQFSLPYPSVQTSTFDSTTSEPRRAMISPELLPELSIASYHRP